MSNKPFRQAVMAIILREDGRILIGSSPRDEGYKFPQGGIDAGETPLECLIRELKEELGVKIDSQDVIGKLPQTVSYHYPPYKPYSKIYCGQEMNIFIIKHQPHFEYSSQDDEFDELVWIFPHDIEQYDCVYRITAYQNALNQLANFFKD
jgi:putative (di)nucleoside polyphosphate hydrolase